MLGLGCSIKHEADSCLRGVQISMSKGFFLFVIALFLFFPLFPVELDTEINVYLGDKDNFLDIPVRPSTGNRCQSKQYNVRLIYL